MTSLKEKQAMEKKYSQVVQRVRVRDAHRRVEGSIKEYYGRGYSDKLLSKLLDKVDKDYGNQDNLSKDRQEER